MKKILLILLCAFVSFAFTNNDISESDIKISAEKHITCNDLATSEDSPCYTRSLSVTFYRDCDGDGEDDLWYSARICLEHMDAWHDFIATLC